MYIAHLYKLFCENKNASSNGSNKTIAIGKENDPVYEILRKSKLIFEKQFTSYLKVTCFIKCVVY